MKRGFLIDMDGVIYNGGEVIEGAQSFIHALGQADVPFMFVTNNSQRTPHDIATKLQRLGFEVEDGQIYTSALATAGYLSGQTPGGTAFVIGEGGLLAALHDHGFAIVDSKPDYVVIGEGRTMTLENMEKAVQFVARGARLIATNLDPNCPTPNGGVRPGCGAFVKLIEVATGKSCLALGKPSPVIFRGARKKMGLRTEEVVMVGDTMETDILGGVQLGYTTVLVLTGGTKRCDLANFSYRPDIIVNSIAELNLADLLDNASPTGQPAEIYGGAIAAGLV